MMFSRFAAPCRTLAALLLLAGGAARAQAPAAATSPEAPGHWFVPAQNPTVAGTTTNTAIGSKSESVTVIAKRPSRTWRSKVTEQLNSPMASDAARPRHTFEKQKPYCNSAMRTVAGQPANAAEMMVGSGAGGC